MAVDGSDRFAKRPICDRILGLLSGRGVLRVDHRAGKDRTCIGHFSNCRRLIMVLFNVLGRFSSLHRLRVNVGTRTRGLKRLKVGCLIHHDALTRTGVHHPRRFFTDICTCLLRGCTGFLTSDHPSGYCGKRARRPGS